MPSRDSSPTEAKRQRLSSDRYKEIVDVQRAQVLADSLASPAVQSVLDDLLQKHRLSESRNKQIQRALHLIKESLDSLPKEPCSISVDSDFLRDTLNKLGTQVDPTCLFSHSNYKKTALTCHPPSNVNVVGSFLLGYSTTSTVDLAVEMPRTLFNSKDYRYYRYHDKRLLYLVFLARHFLSEGSHIWENISITSHCFADDPRKPILSLSHSKIPQVTVCILPTYPPNMFPPSRLTDDRNNLLLNASAPQTSGKADATPVYNQSVLVDSTPLPVLQIMHKVVLSTPNFVSGVLLLNMWSVRHHLLIGNFVFAVLICDLINRSVVPQRASREHILRCAFNSIRSGHLRKLSLSGVRICSPIDVSRLLRVERCASDALNVIESEIAVNDLWNGVIARLFATPRGTEIVPYPLSTQFDGFLKVTLPNSDNCFTAKRAEFDFNVLTVLHTAFLSTGRLSLIEPLERGLYGLSFVSHQEVTRKVDTRKESVDSDSFLSFWGEKASLRRFKDGRIIEAVVWSGGIYTLDEIAQYVFKRHFGGEVACEVFVGCWEKVANLTDGSTSISRAIAAFNELSSLLRSVNDLPLNIRDVHATSTHLRRCGMYPIRPNPANIFTEALDVVITFESSNAWPKDTVALAASKAGFYVALKGKLAEKGVVAQATVSFIDVIVSGYVYRVRLNVDIEKELSDGESDGDKRFWETEMLVTHHDNMRNMQSAMVGQVCRLAKRWLNAHMLFGCLGEHRDVLVELLVMAVFYAETNEYPRSTMSAFCRFLHLLAEFPWEVCPLVVFVSDHDEGDIPGALKRQNDVVKVEGLSRLETLMIAQKSFDQSAGRFGIYVAQANEVESWSEKLGGLENVLLSRLQLTAAASLRHFERILTTTADKKLKLESVFISSYPGFNAVVKIDERACIMDPGSVKGEFGRQKQEGIHRVVAGLDPVEKICKTLVDRLGKWAIFFRKLRCGNQIYIVWRPGVKKVQKFSLRDAAFSDLVKSASHEEDDMLRSSVPQLIDEIKCIGEGLVSAVEVFN